MTFLRPLRWIVPLAGVVLGGCAVVPAEPAYPGPVVYGGTVMPVPPVAAYPGAIVSGGVVVGSGPTYYGAPVYGPPPLFWGPPAPVFVRPPLYYGGPPPYVTRPGGHYRPYATAPAPNQGGGVGSAVRNARKRTQ